MHGVLSQSEKREKEREKERNKRKKKETHSWLVAQPYERYPTLSVTRHDQRSIRLSISASVMNLYSYFLILPNFDHIELCHETVSPTRNSIQSIFFFYSSVLGGRSVQHI